MLDEAQTLEAERSPEHNSMVTEVLNVIHNGRMGQPVILLAAGLGRTKEVFRTLGISRFDSSTFVELGALEKEAEVAVIRDWLTKEGGAVGDPEPWIHAIARETFGWPPPIVAYVRHALAQLDTDQKAMTSEGVDLVLKEGRVARAMYYASRADGLRSEMRRALARPFREIPARESLSYDRIMASLTQDFNPDQADTIFQLAEAKGIISSRDGDYMIPIPSMQNWLISNYAIEPEKDPPSGAPNQVQEQSTKGLESERQKNDPIQWNPDSPAKAKEAPAPPTSSRDMDSGWER